MSARTGTPSRFGWAFIVSAWCAGAFAAPADPAALDALLGEARARALHEQRTWRNLVWYRDGESEVISKDFFLAADGRTSAAHELEATLAGWFDPALDDAHPRCRFPARYQWLASQLALPPTPAPTCARFEKWANFAELESISALMVSGYLGNPASSFGHSLFRLNRRTPQAEGVRLLDTSYSFGALVPKDENVILYVFRGLTGKYESGFSDGVYYSRDQVYTRTQFRDIWEYRLALTPEQQRFMVGHLWEMAGRKFTYYFLTKNCGYRMAELLATVTDRELAPPVFAWYAPSELFHQLMGPAGGHGALIERIDFVPSAQRVVYDRFARLGPSQQDAVNAVVVSEGDLLEGALAALPETERRQALDVLVSYYEYRLASRDEKAPLELRQLKDRVLLARLALPASAEPLPPIPALPPVTDRHPPAQVVGGWRAADGVDAGWFRAAAYVQDMADDPAAGMELAVAELDVDVDQDGAFAVDHLDLIRVRRLQSNAVDLHGESQRSWHIRAGLRRQVAGVGDARFEIAGGVGRAAALAPDVVVYGMAGMVLRDESLTAPNSFGTLVEPLVGLVARRGAWSVELEAADRFDLDAAAWEPRSRLELRWRLGRRVELMLGAEHMGQADVAQLGLVGYW